MKILLHTRFYPNIGGVETVARLLAREWQRLGEEITVVSDVRCARSDPGEFPFPVYYRPNPRQWLNLIRWANVFVHMNISLKALWPVFVVRRPFVASHQSFYRHYPSPRRNWRESLKLKVMASIENIACSEAVANRLRVPCCVIPNPCDISLFQSKIGISRDRELAFVGRLVSEKGCALLIQALGFLHKSGLAPRLTIIGDGPERPGLEQLAAVMKLQEYVRFVGAQPQERVAQLLQEHQILVVPSLYDEPFGVVALEGIASGCVIVGSEGGGLPEAIGPCGLTFPNGDVTALAERLEQLLKNDQLAKEFLPHADNHLVKFHPRVVAKQYLQVIRQALE